MSDIDKKIYNKLAEIGTLNHYPRLWGTLKYSQH